MKIQELPFVDLYSQEYLDGPEAVLGPVRDTAGIAKSARGVEYLTYANATELLQADGFGPGRQRQLQASGAGPGNPLYDTLTRTIVHLEGDPHERQRRSVNRWFTPRKAETWREEIRGWINNWLDDQSDSGKIDLFGAVARPLPSSLVCKIIGAPPEDSTRIAAWSDDILSIVDMTPDSFGRVVSAGQQINEFLDVLIAEKRKSPGDDLLSALIEAEKEGEITAADMADIVLSIITGSTDTTTTQICLNLATLQNRPDSRAELKNNPGMLSGAVLELMRFRPGMLSTPRTLLETDSGHTLPGLDDIDPDLEYMVNIEAANMDPVVYENPTELDLHRQFRGRLPMNFGSGTHGCLGRVLSLIEQEEVLRACLHRWSDYDVLDFHYRGAPTMHFAETFKVAFEPAK
jgi:cytochrome P450